MMLNLKNKMMFSFTNRSCQNMPKDAKYVKDIVAQYSKDRSVKKLISPISDEYFIIDEKNQVSICIGNGKVTIANHTFLYKKLFYLSFTEKLKKQIKESIEVEMQELKKELFENETDLLSKVLNFAKANESNIIKPNFKSQDFKRKVK